jgi:O-methyltransferase
VRWLRPFLPRWIDQQRVKLLAWDIWGYRRLTFLSAIPIRQRLCLLRRFLWIDWNVPHGHKPCEIAEVCRALAERRGAQGEVIVEAGCWQGGSSAKFSILCKMFGYELWIYDSFQGVEPMMAKDKEHSHDYSGEYAAPESLLRSNLETYGEPDVCSIYAGWFAETLAAGPIARPVRLAYLDCDLAKGTREALIGIVPALVEDGWILSQDFHIRPVRALLEAPDTWDNLGKGMPAIQHIVRNLAAIRFGSASD